MGSLQSSGCKLCRKHRARSSRSGIGNASPAQRTPPHHNRVFFRTNTKRNAAA